MGDDLKGIFDELERFSDRAALISDSLDTFSYKELLEVSNSFGELIQKRNLVLMICDNSIGSIASYVGFVRFGIVPLLLDLVTNQDVMYSLCKTYNIKYICSPKLYTENHNETYNIVYSYDKYNLVELKNVNCCSQVHPDLALLLPTSGTTGSPKFVRISYKNLYSNTESISKSLPMKSTDQAITTMPMSYSYGLSIINTHLFNGASILVTNKSFMEKEFWSILSGAKITNFGGVPFIYEMLKRLKFSEMEFDSLKYITQAGGKLSPTLVEYFSKSCKKMGVKFYIMYGQTEATARMSVLSPDDIDCKKDSIGKAIHGGKFSLIDEAGKKVINDIPGELVYLGDNVSMGYAKKYSDLALGDKNKGKLHTGDIAKRDNDDFYYIVGRKNRFVKIFGVRTGLDDMEHFLNNKGIDCVCSGIDNNLKIYITDPDYETRIKKIITANKLVHHKGFSVHYIDSIPRNESGKVIYSKLQ